MSKLAERRKSRAEDRPLRGGSGRLIRVIGLTGRVLVALGLLLLFYTVYLLWGTSVFTKQAQSDLTQQLERVPLVTEQEVTVGDVPPARPANQPELGKGLFMLHIPRLGLKQAVVEGVGQEELKKGPGHFPDCAAVPAGTDCVTNSAWPGEEGNVAISGHRTTFGAPFYKLDELQPGDIIDIRSGPARYRYRVRASEEGSGHKIVPPTAVEEVANNGVAELTLTTCHPRYSAAQRLIVHADYEGAALVESPKPPTAPGERTPTEQERELRPSRPVVPTDVLVLAAVALTALLGATALTPRLRNASVWAAAVAVAGVGLWVVVFPQILELMPANY